MKPFKAFRIQVSDGKVSAGIESITLNDLSPGDVLIKSVYSSINYKDALAATGSGQILKKPCLVGALMWPDMSRPPQVPGFTGEIKYWFVAQGFLKRVTAALANLCESLPKKSSQYLKACHYLR